MVSDRPARVTTLQRCCALALMSGMLGLFGLCLSPYSWVLGVMELPFFLVFGWYYFLRDTLLWAAPPGVSVLLYLLSLVGVVLVIHQFRRWLSGADNQPRLAVTGALVGVALLAALSGQTIGRSIDPLWKLPDRWFTDGPPRKHPNFHIANNLKQQGQAALGFDEEGQGQLPPGAVFDAGGRAIHGWPTLLLPYVGHEWHYQHIRPHPWNAPENLQYIQVGLAVYHHPNVRLMFDAQNRGLMHYASNANVLSGERRISLQQIENGPGLSQTILIGEAAGDFHPWASPIHWRDLRHGLNQRADGFGSPAGKRSVHFVMADGSLRRLTSDVDPAVLEALAGPAR